MTLNKLHLWIGLSGIVLFLLSGQYFQFALNGLQGMDDTPRLLLRTSHVYFFFASFINVIFGLYYVQTKELRWHTVLHQSLVMLSPVLLAYSFIAEAYGNVGIERDIGSLGVIILFVWLLILVLGKVVGLVRPNDK